MSCFYFSNNDNKVLHLKQNLHAKFGNQVNYIEPTNAYVCDNNNRGLLPQFPMIRLNCWIFMSILGQKRAYSHEYVFNFSTLI